LSRPRNSLLGEWRIISAGRPLLSKSGKKEALGLDMNAMNVDQTGRGIQGGGEYREGRQLGKGIRIKKKLSSSGKKNSSGGRDV